MNLSISQQSSCDKFRLKPLAVLVATVMVALALAGCTSDEYEERHPAMEGLEEGWDITITLIDGSEEVRRVFPSERGADFDRDGLDDLQEYMQGTDPNDPDTSGNGLLDGDNVTLARDDPRAQEWIERGIVHFEGNDGRWVFQGARPWRVDPTMQDTVGNGIMDGDEVRGFEVWILGERHVFQTDPRRFDHSGDTIADGLKRDLGLDPTVRDTDSDGISDSNDVNPWIDFQVRFEVTSITLTNDPEGRSERPMRLLLQMTDARFLTETHSVRINEAAGGAGFSSGTLNPSDAGGNILTGQHNITFALTALSTRTNGADLLLDLFSGTSGSDSLFGAIHALNGELYWSQGGPGAPEQPWPTTSTFEGAHGNITLRLVPVWPAAWQHCIEQECRHGDGHFEWWRASR